MRHEQGMNRDEAIVRLGAGKTWDMLIVGGGATGLACAFDAASRGYRTLLLERGDFAQGASSRSTKLIHGGVRYLRQGRVGLVRSALRERSLLMRNAPDLVHARDFIVPVYSGWEKLCYGAGLKCYDLLARGRQPRPSRVLSRDATLAALPTLRPDGLCGGVRYSDAQFDDAALAVALACAAWGQGAVLLNHAPVTVLLKTGGRVCGVAARDDETGATFELKARVVVNATGVFTDRLRRLDDAAARPMLAPSQGAHLVLPKSFLPGDTAMLIPKTSDGRVLFAVPWHGCVLLGTTDTPVAEIPAEPVPFAEEIEFLIGHAGRYLTRAPARADVLSTFAGLRPLVDGRGVKPTSAVSRDHVIAVSASGLLTITGGKWTTCRRMAENAITRAAALARLPEKPCRTQDLRVSNPFPAASHARIHPALPYDEAFVLHAVDATMARTVEDVLARRTRALFLDARASAEAAPRVAALMARLLGRDESWAAGQVRAFRALAAGYILN